ncbi:hypothetical protein AB1L42_19385 [Thalassoglobus sp. JC818]|uniref:hypothetical protein n=1 Tax=Thalassoglobus sp. JC818 TaxID=3232136 RepID=UPI0034579C8A
MTTDFAIIMLGLCLVIAGFGRYLPRLGFSRNAGAVTLLITSMIAFASLSMAVGFSLILPASSESTSFLSVFFDGWWLRDRVSILSLFGLAGGIVTIACAHSIEVGRSQFPKRSEVGSLTLLWALASISVMTDHVVLQWALFSAACWLSVWQCTRMSGFFSNRAWKQVLILLGLADILAMTGLQGMSFIWAIGSFSDLQAVTELVSQDAFQRAVLAVSAIWLGLSFLIRLGGFPFLIWNGLARGSLSSSLVVLMFPALLTVSQIFRWHLILAIDSSSRTMLGGLLVLFALVHAAASIFQAEAQRAFRVSLALVSLVAAGTLFEVTASPISLLFAVACLMLPTAILVFPVPPDVRRLAAAAILLSGIFGSCHAVEQLITVASDPATGTPIILPVLFAVAYALCAASLFAGILSPKMDQHERQPSKSEICLSAVIWLVLSNLLINTLISPERSVGSGLGTTVWLAAVAGILGIVWNCRQNLAFSESLTESTLVKLLNNDFNVAKLLERAAFEPLQQVSTHFQSNLSHLLLAIPGRIFNGLCDDVRLVDESRHQASTEEDTSSRNGLFTTFLLAIIVMIAAIWAAA